MFLTKKYCILHAVLKVAGLSKAKIQLSRPGSAKEPQARTVSNRVHRSVVFQETVSRDEYFGFCCVCADGFQSLSKVFFPIIIFLFASLKYCKLLILKMLCESLLRIPFSVIGRCSPVSPLVCWMGKAPNSAVTDGFWFSVLFYRITFGFLYAFSGSKSPLSGLWRGLLVIASYFK